jgi:hypothetical protein
MELVFLKADREKKSFDFVDSCHLSHMYGMGKHFCVFYYQFLELRGTPVTHLAHLSCHRIRVSFIVTKS